MAYTTKTIEKVSILSSFYDASTIIPDVNSLETIRRSGLEEFLPLWYDFERCQVIGDKRKDLEKWVVQNLNAVYLLPEDVLARTRAERKGKTFPVKEIKDLNYLLVKELLDIPHPDRLDFNAYLFATGKVGAAVGLDKIYKSIYEGSWSSSLSRVEAYQHIIDAQNYARGISLVNAVTVLGDVYDPTKQVVIVDQYPPLHSIRFNDLTHL
ncbi:MAG: hypothetical protein WCV90_07985 [Candidatus Woesearchaeota archaeon]|jgi:hypothetical protein